MNTHSNRLIKIRKATGELSIGPDPHLNNLHIEGFFGDNIFYVESEQNYIGHDFLLPNGTVVKTGAPFEHFNKVDTGYMRHIASQSSWHEDMVNNPLRDLIIQTIDIYKCGPNG